MNSLKLKNLARLHLNSVLAFYMSQGQRSILSDLLDGEEGDWFAQRICEIADIIKAMPATYETEGLPEEEKVVYLHYFYGSFDAWIVERDIGDSRIGSPATTKFQAFGKATVYSESFAESEWGYVDIEDALSAGAELDLHWTPKPAKEC